MGKLGKCTARKYHRLDQIEKALLCLFAEAAIGTVAVPGDDPARTLVLQLASARADAGRMASNYETLFIRFAGQPVDSLAGKSLVRLESAHKAKVGEIAQLELQLAAKRSAKPPIETYEAVKTLIAGLDGEQVPSIAPLPEHERLATRAKIAASLPSIVKDIIFEPTGTFSVRLVDQLPASLPLSRAGRFVRVWQQIGSRYHFSGGYVRLTGGEIQLSKKNAGQWVRPLSR
jgi:hypothetical protein